MTAPLIRHLLQLKQSSSEPISPDAIFGAFIDYVAQIGLELYPAQEEALLEIVSGKNVLLNTPTGSGKSLVATAMHFKSMANGRRSFYTCPIKALVNEKFFALCNEFGPENVGMMTGDASINYHAPIICCTAEVLANMALRDGDRAEVDDVIMDEFHYYADRDRGTAWQVPLLTLPQATFLLMSATFGNLPFFQEKLTQLTGRPSSAIQSHDRPVPLDFIYKETPLHETIADLLKQAKQPIYLVHFSQREAIESAQALTSINVATREERRAIQDEIMHMRFDTPFGKEIRKFLSNGIGVHHAGLLPKYRLLVEKLAQKGVLKIICGTDTLGVGINVPIRTVLITKLCKFNGEKSTILSVRDFKQLAGRAGRKGFDTEGSVVVQAPAHVIENLRLEAQKRTNPSRKIVKKQPPERGYVHWDKKTFERLVNSPPEALESRFDITHGMLLEVLQHPNKGGIIGYQRLIQLIGASHTSLKEKRGLRIKAALYFRALRQGDIIRVERDERHPLGKRVIVNEQLQGDFSLHYALSLYLLDALKMLEEPTADAAHDQRASDEYVLNVISLVESILENPIPILNRLSDKVRRETINELKARGVPFEERQEKLDQVTYPKPLSQFIYYTFNQFAKRHPWVRADNIRPKSIAREMYETGFSFNDYVRHYGLERSEGVLLRYLSETYKVLAQTVPDKYKTEEIEEAAEYFHTLIRHVDTSLLDEWERMKLPASERIAALLKPEAVKTPPKAAQLVLDKKALVRRIRSETHQLLKLLAVRNYEEAADFVAQDEENLWTPQRMAEALKPYYQSHRAILINQEARQKQYTQIRELDGRTWQVTQILLDPQGDCDFVFQCTIDARRAEDNEPLLTLTHIGT